MLKPGHEAEKGAFSAAGGAQKTHEGTGVHGEVYVVQNETFRGVAE